MSRVGGSDVVVVKPANNVYTVMLIVATVAQLLCFLVIFMRFKTMFGAFIFAS